jgi:hypothetical protein
MTSPGEIRIIQPPISAARWQHGCVRHLVKGNKIANDPVTTETREKISTKLESMDI